MGSRHYIPWNSYDMLLRAITKPLALCTSRITKKVVRRAELLKGHYHGFRFQACS
jgi:hypothetical protein